MLVTTGIFKSTCYIDVRWFPFDVQRCELKFGSWTYGGWSLDLKMLEADITGYIANGEWDLVGKRVSSELCPQVHRMSFHSSVPLKRWWIFELSPISYYSRLCSCLQRSQGEGVSVFTNAVMSLTLISRSLWWCADGRYTTASTCSSRASWSLLWLCSSSFCLPTLERRSHWVWGTQTHKYINKLAVQAWGRESPPFCSMILLLRWGSLFCCLVIQSVQSSVTDRAPEG